MQHQSRGVPQPNVDGGIRMARRTAGSRSRDGVFHAQPSFRRRLGGPLFLGIETHAMSVPACGAGVDHWHRIPAEAQAIVGAALTAPTQQPQIGPRVKGEAMNEQTAVGRLKDRLLAADL